MVSGQIKLRRIDGSVGTDGGSTTLIRDALAAALALSLLTLPLAAEAQQAGKVWHLGFLTSGVEGRNLALEIRYAEGRTERFPALAAGLVRLRVDVLVAATTPGTSGLGR